MPGRSRSQSCLCAGLYCAPPHLHLFHQALNSDREPQCPPPKLPFCLVRALLFCLVLPIWPPSISPCASLSIHLWELDFRPTSILGPNLPWQTLGVAKQVTPQQQNICVPGSQAPPGLGSGGDWTRLELGGGVLPSDPSGNLQVPLPS